MNTYKDELWLYHHGVKGQKWGVRRYQNEDGSLTAAGRKRYSTDNIDALKKQIRQFEKSGDKKSAKSAAKELKNVEKERDKIDKKWMKEQVRQVRKEHKDELRGEGYSKNARLKTAFLTPRSSNKDPRVRSVTNTIDKLSSYNMRRTGLDTKIMNKYISKLTTPTGRAVKFVETQWYNKGINGLFDTSIRSKAEFKDLRRKG